MRNNLCSWLVALMMIVPSVLSAQNIDLKLKNVTVQDAITILHQNESYSIIVSADDVNLKQKISINAENAQIQQVLEQIFAGQAPEAFRFGKYLRANEALLPDKIFTINGSSEPAVMAGMRIALIEGEESNFKITTKADLERFCEIQKMNSKDREQ